MIEITGIEITATAVGEYFGILAFLPVVRGLFPIRYLF